MKIKTFVKDAIENLSNDEIISWTFGRGYGSIFP